MTRVLGVVGHPVSHSLSPLMHRRAFAALGMDAAYLPFDVEEGKFEDAIRGAKALSLVGLNVTRPFKEQAALAADTSSQEVKICGAANVLTFCRDGTVVADNTDGKAVLWALEERGKRHIESALFLGAGGAARGVAFALAAEGIHISVTGRTAFRPKALVQELRAFDASAGEVDWEDRVGALKEADLTVQCTPLGGAEGRGKSPLGRRIADARFRPGGLLIEMAYGAGVTPLSAQARSAGLDVVDGVEILSRQAALSWQSWFGVRGPVEIMREAVREALGDDIS